MLIPQFSIRWLLGLTAVCAIISLIVARAIAGSGWAFGVTIALATTLVVLGVHLLFFAGIWLVGVVIAALTGSKTNRRPPILNASAVTVPPPLPTISS